MFSCLNPFDDFAAQQCAYASKHGFGAAQVCSSMCLGKVADTAGCATFMSHIFRQCTTKPWPMKNTADDDENRDTENNSNGGCALTKATDDAMAVTGPSPASTVISVTPPGARGSAP